MSKIKQWFKNIHRICVWIPILWNDRDWDYAYILDILKFKISRNRSYLEKYGIGLDKDKHIKQMKTVECLIERLTSPYCMAEYDEHFKKWGYANDLMLLVINNKRTKQESDEFKRIVDKEEYMWQQDFKYLNSILNKHLRKWWD